MYRDFLLQEAIHALLMADVFPDYDTALKQLDAAIRARIPAGAYQSAVESEISIVEHLVSKA